MKHQSAQDFMTGKTKVVDEKNALTKLKGVINYYVGLVMKEHPQANPKETKKVMTRLISDIIWRELERFRVKSN